MTELATWSAIAVAGCAIAWAMTIPLHRYKEMRPMSPRDIAAEVGTADTPAQEVRASYRSARCGHCRTILTWRDVVPVISWFRGCPHCHRRLPATVPLVQLVLPVVMVLTVAKLDDPWVALPFLWLAVVLTAISVIDLRIWLIPWWMPWAGAAIGLVLISAVSISLGERGQILWAVLGGVGGFALFFVLWLAAPGKLGFGDVRLAVLLGMFTAWIHPALPVYGLLIGSVLGLVMGAVSLAVSRESRFPFGPALALGAMAAIWLNEPILRGLTG